MNIFNMIKIPTAGGCHMYYGNTDDGNWYYATDSWDYGYILSCNPNDYLYDSEGYWSDDFENDIQNYVVQCIDGDDFSGWFDEIVSYAKTIKESKSKHNN